MTVPDEPLSRVDEPISGPTAEALQLVMQHLRVPLPEALRIAVGWGAMVFQAHLDHEPLYVRRGNTFLKIVLIHQGEDLVSAPVVWMRPESSAIAHAVHQAEVTAGLHTVMTVCHDGPYKLNKLRRDDLAERCHACQAAVQRGREPVSGR